MSHEKPRLISVVGPTAVGKTALAIELAELLRTEIVSADSRQFYCEMTIGTAKPTDAELLRARHHFINSHSISEFYSAGDFERDALLLLENLFQSQQNAVAVGGSGLYLKALWEGFDDIPEVDEKYREQLNHEFLEGGLEPLLLELYESDPTFHSQVDKHNHQRVIRALEIIRGTGKPFSDFRKSSTKQGRRFENLKIGLQMDREKLNERINVRMDHMIQNGLFAEAEKLMSRRNQNALQTVGYKEIFGYLDGDYDKEEAIRLLKRNSRRYAKRQMTWFKADPEIKWFDAGTSAREIMASLQLK